MGWRRVGERMGNTERKSDRRKGRGGEGRAKGQDKGRNGLHHFSDPSYSPALIYTKVTNITNNKSSLQSLQD